MRLVLCEACIWNSSPAPPSAVSRGARVSRQGQRVGVEVGVETVQKRMTGDMRQVNRIRIYLEVEPAGLTDGSCLAKHLAY